MAKADPVRTCIGCRRAGSARELVRIARTLDGRLVIGGPSQGRGAWVGPALQCADSAVAALRKVFGPSVASEWGPAWRDFQAGREDTWRGAPAWCPRTATRTTSYDRAESCEDTDGVGPELAGRDGHESPAPPSGHIGPKRSGQS